MSGSFKKTLDKKSSIAIHGWIMDIKPFYTVSGEKFGEKLTIKTVARKLVNEEEIPIYIGNLIVKTGEFTENLRPFNSPVEVHVKGLKRGEKVYPNMYKDGPETTDFICWVYLYRKKMSIKRPEKGIPDFILRKFKIEPPAITFASYHSQKSRERDRLAMK